MKTHTVNYKNNIKKMGRMLDSIITYTINNEQIVLGKENINSITPHYEGSILKTTMKQLDIDCNIEIPVNTEINYQFGVKVNGTYEYINFGNYIVNKVERQEDTKSYKIICYDKMLLFMVDYRDMGVIYPITLRNYLNEICTTLGIDFENEEDDFANYDRVLTKELYLTSDGGSLGYTYRDVLDDIAGATASTICINADDKLEIRYINNTNDTIDEEFLKDVNVAFGEKFGPINSIVLSRSAESDNVYLRDDVSVAQNGLCEIKIVDNMIMNDLDRGDYLPDILEKLDGLEYYENDFSSTGITYYDLCDKYNVSIDNNVYSCIMFNNEINITQGLEEIVYTKIPETAETDYNHASGTDKAINKVYIIAKKNELEIEAVVSSVEQVNIKTDNNYQEVINKFGDYVPQSDFITLENSVTQIQTNTYTKVQVDSKLVDGSVTKVVTTAGTFDENGLTIEKSEAKTKTNVNEAGMVIYDTTGSSETELLKAGYDNQLNETIVRTKNIKVDKYLSIGRHSRIEDYEDGTGIFYIE